MQQINTNRICIHYPSSFGIHRSQRRKSIECQALHASNTRSHPGVGVERRIQIGIYMIFV